MNTTTISLIEKIRTFAQDIMKQQEASPIVEAFVNGVIDGLQPTESAKVGFSMEFKNGKMEITTLGKSTTDLGKVVDVLHKQFSEFVSGGMIDKLFG